MKKKLFYTSGIILACLILANSLRFPLSINFDSPVLAKGEEGCCSFTLVDSSTGLSIPNAKVEMLSKELYGWCGFFDNGNGQQSWFFRYSDSSQTYSITCQINSPSYPSTVSVSVNKEGYPSKTAAIPSYAWGGKVYLSKNVPSPSPSPKVIPTPKPSPQLQNPQDTSSTVNGSPKIPKLSLNRAPSEPIKEKPQQTKFLGITLSGRNKIILIVTLTILLTLITSSFILSFIKKRNPPA
ncbi:MAG: hypothetical protein UU34_C0010G0021 [Candidatus Curtissbacteria bacterium GW2011_GWA1_41_11]|uniref:Uncharacterized protein n=1 Tax=Candidatus Curtissbacteria bacterium GW2011_GWA1_41_11 TaxID=1618409 RepID=A0A0G0UCU3_9BACT|nr:MAG: hypothetical protein UU34_C0010G0021 [Candidatus Curtissbacteria bacterium GW2011_GWA1_41_11]